MEEDQSVNKRKKSFKRNKVVPIINDSHFKESDQ
jgi:hypothetical protein